MQNVRQTIRTCKARPSRRKHPSSCLRPPWLCACTPVRGWESCSCCRRPELVAWCSSLASWEMMVVGLRPLASFFFFPHEVSVCTYHTAVASQRGHITGAHGEGWLAHWFRCRTTSPTSCKKQLFAEESDLLHEVLPVLMYDSLRGAHARCMCCMLSHL